VAFADGHVEAHHWHDPATIRYAHDGGNADGAHFSFVSAANPAPDFPEALRGGINLYTNSLIALHARTGKLAWFDQMVPNDDHDWDLTLLDACRADVELADREGIDDGDRVARYGSVDNLRCRLGHNEQLTETALRFGMLTDDAQASCAAVDQPDRHRCDT